MTIPNAPHQKLIDGLGYHVLLGEISKTEADTLIAWYMSYPEALDQAILFQVRKTYGLAPPTSELPKRW